jgi:hypothetical protein
MSHLAPGNYLYISNPSQLVPSSVENVFNGATHHQFGPFRVSRPVKIIDNVVVDSKPTNTRNFLSPNRRVKLIVLWDPTISIAFAIILGNVSRPLIVERACQNFLRPSASLAASVLHLLCYLVPRSGNHLASAQRGSGSVSPV